MIRGYRGLSGEEVKNVKSLNRGNGRGHLWSEPVEVADGRWEMADGKKHFQKLLAFTQIWSHVVRCLSHSAVAGRKFGYQRLPAVTSGYWEMRLWSQSLPIGPASSGPHRTCRDLLGLSSGGCRDPLGVAGATIPYKRYKVEG